MDNPDLVSTFTQPQTSTTNNRGLFFKKVKGLDHSSLPSTKPSKTQLQPKSNSNSQLSTVNEHKLFLNDDSTQESLSQFNFTVFPTVMQPSSQSKAEKKKKKKKKSKGLFNFGNFTRHMSMTPYTVAAQGLQGAIGPRDHEPVEFNTSRRSTATSTSSSKNSKISIDSSEIRDKYQTDLKTWNLTTKANKNYKHGDPLTYAPERLTSFLETYDLVLEKPRAGSAESDLSNASQNFSLCNKQNPFPLLKELQKSPLKISEQIDLIGFWSLSALKFISNVDVFLTNNVITEFSNFNLKENDKIRVLNTQGEFFGLQWVWQLALDNPAAEIYDFTLNPIIPTSYTNFKQTIGPSNFHPIHGESLSDLSFSKNSFAFAVCYDLWLQLKSHEWVPVLSEIQRVLLPCGTIHMLLLDFDIVNCANVRYRSFFTKLQRLLVRNGIDPFPCKHITQRLRESGFESIKYSLISLKKGLPNKVGNLMEFLQSYFEFIIFYKIARFNMDQEDLEDFKELKLQYHQETKSGRLLNEFGNSYCMFVFAKKGTKV